MLLTIAQRSVLIVIEAPTKVINLFLRELKQREAAYAAVAAKHQVGDALETQTRCTLNKCFFFPGLQS
jgi:hypothetical protein